MKATPVLYLFDIDGTLVHCDGVGRRAMAFAFQRLFQVPDAFDHIDFRGSLDSRIVLSAFDLAGIPPRNAAMRAFRSLYLQRLRETLEPSANANHRFCPGIPRVLPILERQGNLGLVTGNWKDGAYQKLRAFGIWERFRFGAFGDDADQRDLLVPIALRRARRLGLATDRVVVIGDTPDDVGAARAGGAMAVAVCTGWSSREELSAAEPDLLLDNLDEGLEQVLAL